MTFLWSDVEAARSMPWDSMLFRVLGSRFAMIMIFLNRIGAFLILSVLNIFEICSADSGMKGWRRVAISFIALTVSPNTHFLYSMGLESSHGFLS